MTLPTPDPAFDWTAEAWGPALRSKPLSTIAQHAFTSKQLQLRGGPEAQPTSWAQAATSVGGSLNHVIRVKQVHGAVVRVLKKGQTLAADLAQTPDADAIVSNLSGLVLSVQVADCVPILVADDRGGSAAAIHAGWRGTCAGIAPAAIDAMAHEFGCDPANLIAAIGPSIGPCCYEVGQKVLDAFRRTGATDEHVGRWFRQTHVGSLWLDLWAANRDQLVRAGLRADRIAICGLCTQTHHDVFESYRVDRERAGRMAALIAVP
jgi:purine-nucleoside/S-methyl-5'-thioadenosine phosphorylase / adenosine deaminase